MHGYNQGSHTVRDLVCSVQPEIFLLQEHWLTPANLCRFDENFPQYMCFGSSAMGSIVESGVLRGRPFGGVMTLIHRKLQTITRVVCVTERIVIIIVGDLVIANVYLPCVGVTDRLFICDEMFNTMSSYLDTFPNFVKIIGGDFNTDLDSKNSISD